MKLTTILTGIVVVFLSIGFAAKAATLHCDIIDGEGEIVLYSDETRTQSIGILEFKNAQQHAEYFFTMSIEIDVIPIPDLPWWHSEYTPYRPYTPFINLSVLTREVTFSGGSLSIAIEPVIASVYIRSPELLLNASRMFTDDGSGWVMWPGGTSCVISDDGELFLKAENLDHLSSWGGIGHDPLLSGEPYPPWPPIPEPSLTIVLVGLLGILRFPRKK